MARVQGKVNLTAGIAPFDTADTYETHSAIYGKGGWRTVTTIEERDAIPEQRREELMVVAVTENGEAYQLVGGISNEDWQPLVLSQKSIKVIVFIFPGQVSLGVQRVYIPFPFKGRLVGVTASVIDVGFTPTKIQVQKISQYDYLESDGQWAYILDNPLLIEPYKKSSLVSYNEFNFVESMVNLNDYFRIEVLEAGNNAFDLSVEILVELL